MHESKKRGRVAVGMSGGTDSSAVAAMLVDEGYEVIGLTAHMWKEGSRCCSLEDVERARGVCTFLDIRHYVVNAQDLFTEKIVDPLWMVTPLEKPPHRAYNVTRSLSLVF